MPRAQLTDQQKAAAFDEIADILYPVDNPDLEWTGDTLPAIGDIMDAALHPDGK